MTPHSRSNLITGMVFVAIALLVALVWIPLDTETGLIEKVRRRVAIGDALAPTLACFFLLLGGLHLILRERSARHQPTISRDQITFIGRMLTFIILGVLVMRYTGPMVAEAVNLFRAEPMEYRLLRANPGWKHIGFVAGGMIMVAGMISLVERRFTARALLTALAAVLIIIAIFDLPFEDLLIPPNGDV